jgi:ABC-2 type transport system permease protein
VRHRAVLLLARRSLRSRFRHPSMILPDLAGPLLFTAVLWGSFAGTIVLPGFPTVHSYLDFVLVATVVVGVFFSASDVGDDVAADIASGFFDRLVASPVARSALVLGRLAGAAAFAVVETVLIVAVLVGFGASVQGGVAALLAITMVMTVMAVAVGGLGANLALRSRFADRTAALFVPACFLLLFVSSAYFPRDLMHGWFGAMAGVNPVSWLVEDLRHQVVVGFAPARVAQALGIMAVLAVASVWSAVRAVRRRAEAQ